MSLWVFVCSDGLTILAEMASWLGRSDDQAKYSAQAAALKGKINQLMFNGSAFCDGTCAAVHLIVCALQRLAEACMTAEHIQEYAVR